MNKDNINNSVIDTGKNLIFCAYAYIENYCGSTQINVNRRDVYYKNILVALSTAKYHNPSDDVALITNVEIPRDYVDFFKRCDIKVIYHEFDMFKFADNCPWSLAYYKLCALDYVLKQFKYQRYMLLDVDTVTVKTFSDIWLEVEQNILIFDIHHGISIDQAKRINEEYNILYGEKIYLVNYGGELIAGNRIQLIEFLNKCHRVYKDICEHNMMSSQGDEFIISVAAKGTTYIKAANAYINRFWTGRVYYVSTNYYYDGVCILHLPLEKDSGIIKIYNYIYNKNKQPYIKEIARWCGLPKLHRPDWIRFLTCKLISVIKKRSK